MPIRNFLILVGLFAVCFAIVAIAWLSGSELYLFLPGRRHFGPPTHPGVILAVMAVAALLCCWLQFMSVTVVTLLAAGICLGIPIGNLVHSWTPGICQYLLATALGVIAWYGWTQRDYLTE